MHPVAIVKVVDQKLDHALASALELLGGVETVLHPGDRVLIKPNLVFSPTNRGTTHPELIEAVVRLAADTSPGEIVIAEGSADCYTGQSFRLHRVHEIAARYGAKVLDLNLEEGVRTPVPEGLGREYIMLPRAVVECDRFVSLPVFKLWSQPMSLALKNLIGLYGGRYYGHNKNSIAKADDPQYAMPGETGTEMGAHQPDLAASICALSSVVETHLAVVDALEGGDGKGSWMRLNTLVAGLNATATDMVCLAMSGFGLGEAPHLQRCTARGLGPTSLAHVDVRGASIDDAFFDLRRLAGGVLEMPQAHCLSLLTPLELKQVWIGIETYGLASLGEWHQDTEYTRSVLTRATTQSDYFDRAIAALHESATALLDLIIERGGTASTVTLIAQALSERIEGGMLHYWPAMRTLLRLGLAYVVDSASAPYFLVAEGVVAAFRRKLG